MALKELILEDEPEMEISYVPLSESSDQLEEDPELPGQFLAQDDLDVLQDSAVALEAIGVRIACEGMDYSSARELDALIPNYIRNHGGPRGFTSRPSLEGLADGANAVKQKLMEIIQRVRQFVATMYKRFSAWLTQKFSRAEAQDVAPAVAEFVAKRQNRDAMKFMSDLPEKPDEAADEVARLMDGDTKAFTAQCTDQFQTLTKNVAAIEKMMTDNPTHFRLATGVISVKELFKEDANSAISLMLKKAAEVADNSMKARNNEQFMQAIQNITAVTQEMDEFDKNMVVNDESSEQYGDGQAISLDKLFDNINTVAEELKRVDVKAQVAAMNSSIEHIVKISEGTEIEEIMEMIPEDVPAEKHSVFGNQIAALYRRIAKLGADILRLWKVRADSVESINKVGGALVGLVDGFEKAVVACGTTITPEQKAQLVKALAAKGFTVEF